MRRQSQLIAALAVVALATAAAACGDETTRFETGSGETRGITVSGQGRATARPDVAMVTLGVSSRADNVAAAREQAAASLDAMLASVTGNGVDDEDVQTQQFSIQPEYDFRDGEQILRGYVVTNTVSVKVREIDNTSKIVDDAVVAGGDNTRIDNIFFTIDDPKELQDQAREGAVADARAKAETLARASGVDLGDAINISEGTVFPPIPFPATGAAERGLADTATPIEPGTLDVTIDVSVTFEIK